MGKYRSLAEIVVPPHDELVSYAKSAVLSNKNGTERGSVFVTKRESSLS